MPSKSVKGVTPPTNEAQIDHNISEEPGRSECALGTNSYNNARVLCAATEPDKIEQLVRQPHGRVALSRLAKCCGNCEQAYRTSRRMDCIRFAWMQTMAAGSSTSAIRPHRREKDAAVVSLHNIVQLDPTVADLADLPLGWHAWRDSRRFAVAQEHGEVPELTCAGDLPVVEHGSTNDEDKYRPLNTHGNSKGSGVFAIDRLPTMKRPIRKIAFVSPHCVMDFTNGAATATLDGAGDCWRGRDSSARHFAVREWTPGKRSSSKKSSQSAACGTRSATPRSVITEGG